MYFRLKLLIRGIFAKWLKVLFRPSVVTFTSEVSNANWATPFLGVLIFVAVYTAVVLTGIAPWYGRLDRYPGLVFESEVYFFIASGLMLIATIIYAVVRRSHGTVDYRIRAYLCSLYIVPLGIIGYLLSLVPGLLFFGPLATFIYGLFITYFMVQPIYDLDSGIARKVVFRISLIPIYAFLSFFIFLAFTFGGF